MLDKSAGVFRPVTGIQTDPIYAAIALRRKFHGFGKSFGFFGSRDVRDHQGSCAVLQQPIQTGFFERAGAPDAVNVSQMMKGHKRLDFSRIEGAVLAVNPYAVKTESGGVFGKE